MAVVVVVVVGALDLGLGLGLAAVGAGAEEALVVTLVATVWALVKEVCALGFDS